MIHSKQVEPGDLIYVNILALRMGVIELDPSMPEAGLGLFRDQGYSLGNMWAFPGRDAYRRVWKESDPTHVRWCRDEFVLNIMRPAIVVGVIRFPKNRNFLDYFVLTAVPGGEPICYVFDDQEFGFYTRAIENERHKILRALRRTIHRYYCCSYHNMMTAGMRSENSRSKKRKVINPCAEIALPRQYFEPSFVYNSAHCPKVPAPIKIPLTESLKKNVFKKIADVITSMDIGARVYRKGVK